MHASAMAQMKACVDQYLRPGKHYRVLDLGSRQIREHHETQQSLLTHLDYEYVGADVVAGPNVDLVMRKPYRIPARSNSFDVVMSNQAFEHIPFPWASFLEMSRVVKPGGYIFIVAPSRGHRHGTTDCWRYYPDSMRALAAFARMGLVESYVNMPPKRPGSDRVDYAAIDEQSSYWGDAVGVFRKPDKYSKLVRLTGGTVVWWANRVGGVDHVPPTKALPVRRRISRRLGARDQRPRPLDG